MSSQNEPSHTQIPWHSLSMSPVISPVHTTTASPLDELTSLPAGLSASTFVFHFLLRVSGQSFKNENQILTPSHFLFYLEWNSHFLHGVHHVVLPIPPVSSWTHCLSITMVHYTTHLLIHLVAKLTPSLTLLPSHSLCFYCPSLESQLRGLEHSSPQRFLWLSSLNLPLWYVPLFLFFFLATAKVFPRRRKW